jgi:hypothetical protein
VQSSGDGIVFSKKLPFRCGGDFFGGDLKEEAAAAKEETDGD